MALQTKINGSLVKGVVGEFSDGSPKSARAYKIYGTETKNPTFGHAFYVDDVTVDDATGAKITVAKMGVSSGVSAGIFVNPKEHYVVGFKTDRAIATKEGVGTIAKMGHIWVMVSTNVTAGGKVYVATADGALTTNSSDTELKGATWLATTTANLQSDYETYSTTKAYAVGDKVKNSSKFYVCKTATEGAEGSPEAFAATKWTEVETPATEVLAEVAIDNPVFA